MSSTRGNFVTASVDGIEGEVDSESESGQEEPRI